MNYTLTIPNSLRKSAALLAIVSLLATSLPIGVLTAFAANEHIAQIGITDSIGGDLEVNETRNFVLQAQDGSGASTTTATSLVVTLSDDGGGIFYEGTIGGACSTPLGGNTVTISSGDAQKAFCYSNAAQGSYTITADGNNDSVAVSGDIGVNVVDTSGGPAPVLTPEEFVTVDGSYKGISVGFRTENFGTAATVSVTIERADGSTVTKTANQGVLDIINQDTSGGDQLTAPFVIEEGTFTEASDTLYWDPAPTTWDTNTRPVEVTITVTDEGGDTVAVNSTFNDGSPSWPTYESLLPPPPYVYPSTNEKNKTGTNTLQTGPGPHVSVISDSTPGEITLAFVNPKNYVACFEYRTDGDTSQDVGTANPNPAIDDRYPHVCVTASTSTQTFNANGYIEVRSVFGAERDWDFDWTSFNVLPPPTPVPTCDTSDTLANTTFDTFATGSVNGQNNWNSTGPYDQEVVDNTYGYSSFGCKSLRISNEITTGSFGDQTFAAPLTDSVGEVDATAGSFSEGTRYNRYEVEFDIASTKPSEQQSGLALSVSPDRGDGSRMSYLSFADAAGGIDVTFYDVQGTDSPANFIPTSLVTLDRSVPHTIKFVMEMNDGPSNDVVEIYIDGALEHTGTSWENYFRFDTEAAAEQSPRLMKTLLFRSAGSAAPANAGNGFLFDNISLVASDTSVTSSAITNPATDGEVVSGTTTLAAFYSDENGDNNDAVQWAVRTGVCSGGINTVLGNVDGHSDDFGWDNTNFTAEFDTTAVDNGDYCFVFNPTEDSGDVDQRLTRLFAVENMSLASTTFTATPSGTAVLSGGYTQEEHFTFNLTASGSVTRYQLKYWNDIVGSSFKQATPWNPTNLAPYSSSLGVYNDRFTQGEGVHYFSFSACNASDVCSPYSEPFVVNYDTTVAPEMPEHLSPEDEAVQNFNDFYFDWTDVDGAVEYEFQSSQNPAVDGDGVLTTGVWNNKTGGAPDRDYLTESEIHSYGANGTWYWQVRTIDTYGNQSDWTEPWMLTIDMVGPTVPQITHPVDEQIFEDTPISNEWTVATDSSGIDYYQIAYQYDDGHTFGASTCPDVTMDGDWVGCRDVDGTSRNHAPALSEQGGVTIWVRSFDNAGNASDWSDPVHYYYNEDGSGPMEDHTPAVPTNLGWNDSNSNPVSNGGTTELVSGTALWDANTEPDFNHYIYKYWNNISTSAYNSTSSAWTVNNGATNSRSGSFTEGEGTHYFCIVAVDNAGHESECSDEFTIIYDTNSPDPTNGSSTQTVSGNTAVGENQPGWLFNRDTSTQSPYSFVLGTSTIGTGSLFINPITNTGNGNNDKFIAELFLLSPIAQLDSLSYDFNIAAVDATDENEFYMSVYANFGSSSSTNYYDCRYSVVPTVGVVNGWTTVTFNPASTYPVAKWGGSTSIHACPTSPDAMDTLDSGSKIRAIALNVGDTSANDLGVSGYFDNVVVVQTTGLHTETTIYDFEPTTSTTTTETDTDSNGGGGGGGGGRNNDDDPTPTVAGASTDSEMYDLLEEIKNRLAEFLLASYSEGQTPAFQGSVLGASVAQAQTGTPNQEGDSTELEEIATSTPIITADDEDEESEGTMALPSWQNYYWLLVLLWLLSSAGALWRRNEFPETLVMRAVQGTFIAVALLLLAGAVFFGLAGAFWPSLIVTIGAITAYFWSLE